jgi:dethiobiotin synthetase
MAPSSPVTMSPMDAPAQNPRSILKPYSGPGLFITGTGTDVGKTMVTAALAAAFHQMHVRVGICKAIASGCPKFRHRGNKGSALSDDDFQSPDAEFAARAAGLDPTDESLLRYLSPIRFAAPVAPATAAKIEGRPPNWRRLEGALDWWQENCQVLLVEGAGGWYVPLDEHGYMIADMATALRLPVLVVTHAGLGAINQTLLTVHAIRERSLPVAGLVMNRIPPEGERDLAIESNLEEIGKLSNVPVRGLLPDRGTEKLESVPQKFVEALSPFAQEWWRLVNPS